MKVKIILSMTMLTISSFIMAQELSPETLVKRERRRNLTVKEWNTDSKEKTRWMDHVTVYDEQGRKIEETEYSNYGQKQRIVIQYTAKGFIEKEIVYNDRNKPVRIRKYEYNADGSKKKQYNYLPNGRLYTIKTFEYLYADEQ